MQLTLLYAGPFFVSGAILLAVPLVGVRSSVPVNAPVGTHLPSVEVHRQVSFYAIGLAVMVVVSLVLGWLIAGRFLRPLRTITATARDISASNLHRRLGLNGRRDEFTDLTETLNDLFGRLEASFDSQRHFVANASHELRTPLTAERALLQVALADPTATAETLRATCRDVLALGKQQERLIEALLTLASGEQGIEDRVPFDLAEIAGNVVRDRLDEARRRRLTIMSTLDTAATTGDPSLVASLVVNLVDNALRHNIAGGRISIATASEPEWASISVRNTGTVVPPDELDRLFQPFQQLGGERVRHTDGHGLGLAIVRAIASAHGATVVPGTRPEGGLVIEVRFPVRTGSRQERPTVTQRYLLSDPRN
jgi:signal transduction histidine kinase